MTSASRGKRLVDSIRAEMTELNLVPTAPEQELLRVTSTLADRLDELERIIKRDGLMVPTPRGIKTNPAAVEHRAVATSLARTLGAIRMADTTAPTPAKEARKQRAARRKWAVDHGAA